MGSEEKEKENKMVAVLRVTKKGAILKNIILLSREKEGENVISVGRSVDCDINLSHPSISRFHLHLYLGNSLSVLDLNSVHGTWVMGNKIEPDVRVELNEGDTMQIGGSSRVYKLHWVPLSEVHDIENSFVSPSDVCEQIKDRDQEGILEVEESESQKENMTTPLDAKNQNIMDTESKQNLGSLRSSASLIRTEYTETPDSASLSLFSEIEIQQLDKEYESQEENMSSLLETKRSSEINQDERITNPSIFSENHVTGCEILSSSDDIILKTENQQFDEENSAPKLLQERTLTMSSSRSQKSGKKNSLAERVPFQPLFDYSTGLRKSETYALTSATKSCDSLKHAETTEMKRNLTEDKWKWHMVVDTACLLNKESRKVLQLLQGLKGTQMIIPRSVMSVIRELDSMDRQGSLFKRKTEASWALQWIEECMVSSDWWIHVQSLEEEPRPTAATPPVISNSRFSEVCCRFSGIAACSAFSAWGNLFEIVTPAAGDQVLECALQLRGTESYGKVVLLSDDITLKIKAMAEGLMCETAQEFRDSLVNPFSERFLWSDSSPRGLTWSCKDDIFLKEKFYRHSMKLGEREGAKGLKLIISTRHLFTLTPSLPSRVKSV